ncbi:hypothetical protein LJC46_01080 [Desulfovibrio sp. OttesenSCG-928-G15]|nr:hypothetical protein [Desulfovibrio sp. OttesenSCG-928-G15]
MVFNIRALCLCLLVAFSLAALGCAKNNADNDYDPPRQDQQMRMPDPGLPTESSY